eukprot:scaffold100011_cov30-Tisochrysis_lutea.AAC.2
MCEATVRLRATPPALREIRITRVLKSSWKTRCQREMREHNAFDQGGEEMQQDGCTRAKCEGCVRALNEHNTASRAATLIPPLSLTTLMPALCMRYSIKSKKETNCENTIALAAGSCSCIKCSSSISASIFVDDWNRARSSFPRMPFGRIEAVRPLRASKPTPEETVPPLPGASFPVPARSTERD